MKKENKEKETWSKRREFDGSVQGNREAEDRIREKEEKHMCREKKRVIQSKAQLDRKRDWDST